MYLAQVINKCEDELICDMASEYGVFDYESLNPSLLATLTVGLPLSSRVKMKMSGQKLTIDQTLMALILDDLNLMMWLRNKKHGSKPKSAYKLLTEEPKPKDELMKFKDVESFEEWYRSTHHG